MSIPQPRPLRRAADAFPAGGTQIRLARLRAVAFSAAAAVSASTTHYTSENVSTQ